MFTLFALLVSAAPCVADTEGYCTDPIVRSELSYEGTSPIVRVNCALGDVVSISFPENVQLRGEPALGNAGIFDFRTQKNADVVRLFVWPKMPAGASLSEEALLGGRSNLQIFLDSGVTIQLELKIAKKDSAVSQVVFSFPERVQESDFLKEKLAEQARRLEKTYSEKAAGLDGEAQKRAEKLLARSFLRRHHCTELDERSMVDFLIVHAHSICQIGDHVLVGFSIKNRARGDLFHLERIEVAAPGDGDDARNLDALVEYTKPPLIGFGETVEAMAIFAVDDRPAREYVLTVHEDGGKKRTVRLSKIEF